MNPFKTGFIIAVLMALAGCSSLPEVPLQSEQFQNVYSETPDEIVLQSGTVTPTIGFVFYPGGLVDPHAYLKWQDELVTLYPQLKIITVKMPGNLAVLGINKGVSVVKATPSITQWITGGHSLGGTMAAELVKNHPDMFSALVFIASYPADDVLKTWKGAVLSVHAGNDGLSTVQKIETNEANLPAAVIMTSETDFQLPLQQKTHYYEIEGGNHAQFGNYGVQSGDLVATISADEQQQQLIAVIAGFVANL